MPKTLFDKLKATVFEDEPKAPTKPVVFAPSTPSFATTPGFTPSFAPSPQPIGVDPQLIAEVEQMMASQHSPVYTQFGALLASMQNIPDEHMRFVTALSVAKTLNLAPDAIRQAYEDRLKALDGIEANFASQSEQERQRRDSLTQGTLTKLTSDISQREATLQQLQTELQQLKVQQADAAAAQGRDRQELNTLQANMHAAIDAVRTKATAERDTISRNIGGS